MKRYNNLFATKFDELVERERFLKSTECTSTDNTKSSQLNKVRRERKTLTLIKELVTLLPDDTKLTPASSEHLENILTLVSERQSAIHFECQAGDKVMDLLQKYKNMDKLMKRMSTFCEKQGLEIDWQKGVVVKKAAGTESKAAAAKK